MQIAGGKAGQTGNSQCKGLEAEARLKYSRNDKEASVAVADRDSEEIRKAMGSDHRGICKLF